MEETQLVEEVSEDQIEELDDQSEEPQVEEVKTGFGMNIPPVKLKAPEW